MGQMVHGQHARKGDTNVTACKCLKGTQLAEGRRLGIAPVRAPQFTRKMKLAFIQFYSVHNSKVEFRVKTPIPKVEFRVKTLVPKVEFRVKTLIPIVEFRVKTPIPKVEFRVKTYLPGWISVVSYP